MFCFPCFLEELDILQLIITISFQFFVCFILHCFMFTLTNRFISIPHLNIQGMPYFSTVRKIMASCTKKSHGEKDNSTRNENPLKGEKNIKEAKDDVECEDTTTKSSSYTLYIATIIAVLGAICSVGQFDSLTNFIEEFSAGLCATSLTDNLDGSSNGTVVTDFGLSSKYDPILKDGETYDALSAIKSRYVNISVCNILFISSKCGRNSTSF